jgi:N-acetylneuraminate synthase
VNTSCRREIALGNRAVGDGHPVYIVAEIGINHNGDMETAKKLIAAAHEAGCDAVKFQKRTPDLCVPESQKMKMRDTPWGYITYLEYRHRVEFGREQYEEIDAYCRALGIAWFASCWDEEAVDFIEAFDPLCFKIQSAAVTDIPLLTRLRDTGRPLILSTGMSTMEEIRAAVGTLGTERLLIAHATSTYPCPNEHLNLRMLETLRGEFPCPIGYSGHEVGLPTTVAAVALGACLVERHITLDRAMWGSDQPASIEPGGFKRLVSYIRVVEAALGDGVKHVYEDERDARERLRRV